MEPGLIGMAAYVPVITGLVEALKRAGLPGHLAPALSVVLGVLVEVLTTYGSRYPELQTAMSGAVLGLSAAGLYSGGKAVKEKLSGGQAASPRPVPTTWGGEG